MSQEHPHIREVRVVVLGGNHSGKTSLINTVLGQQEPEPGVQTASCMRREGEFDGRKLIFIDTPGWWRNYLLIDTSEFIKQELVLSVSKCPPGPHAFILVIGTDVPFTEKNRRSTEEHLGLFGEKVWSHTIVVFTTGDSLKGKSIEQHIANEGEALKWLLDKCGNRFHVFYECHCTEGRNNVIQLLDQIDDTVAKHGKNSFELDEKTLKAVEVKRNTHQEKAKLRRKKVTDQRDKLHKYGVIPSLPELRILLVGWLFSGKTSANNTILGRVGDVSRTRTYQSQRKSGEVAGRRVSVVDTPSWWKYLPARYTPEWVKKELQRGLTLDSKVPHAILLTVPVDTSFQEEQRKITEDNMKMFGEQIWRHTMVLFTSGDLLGETTIEEHIESEGKPLQWLVEKCGNRYHVMSWYDREDKVMELLQKIEEMGGSNSLFWSEPRAEKTVVEETTEKPKEIQREMGILLDQKWQRLDKEMEEMIRGMRSEIAAKGNGSMDAYLDFSDNRPSTEDTLEEINKERSSSQLSLPEPQSAITDEFTGQEDQEQTGERNTSEMERMREMLEREWGRREIGITNRFQQMLSDLRESGVSSEADVHDLNQSFRKVLWWMHHGTSGHGSMDDLQTEEIH